MSYRDDSWKAGLDRWLTTPPEPPAWWEPWLEEVEADYVCEEVTVEDDGETVKGECGGRLEYLDSESDSASFKCVTCGAVRHVSYPDFEPDPDRAHDDC